MAYPRTSSRRPGTYVLSSLIPHGANIVIQLADETFLDDCIASKS